MIVRNFASSLNKDKHQTLIVMTIILNSISDNIIVEKLKAMLEGNNESFKVWNTVKMNIHHCMGCNHCFLKTPGICSIKDDYEEILKSLAHADNIWLIADTNFGFVDSKGKKVMDRLLPLLNMGLEFREGIMRHTLRYEKKNVGLIYIGNGDQNLLDFWCQRTAGNLGGQSLGAYSSDKIMEVKVCM